ncbi:oxygen-dependent coproporphyrinogen oxidase [Niabella aquatica]
MRKEETKTFRDRWIRFVYHLQETICSALETEDGAAKFKSDTWERAGGKGGGGLSCIMENGVVFEKAGVNVSVVYGKLTGRMKNILPVFASDEGTWFACGISLVLHTQNPFVPAVHANWRYFELHNEEGRVVDRWFGGGSDITPYYLYEDDIRHFHTTFKNAIDPFGKDLYPLYKKQCDEYFSNTHRDHEMRGLGGVFYDHLKAESEAEAARLLAFQEANGNAFLKAYLPIVQKRKNIPYAAENKTWQEIRRGRYVEFNLLHDRGTVFGIKTKGRTESILMSLPPTVKFIYDYHPEPGTEEDKLLQACKQPRDWVVTEISEEEWAGRVNKC